MFIQSYLQSKANPAIKAASSWEASQMAKNDPENQDLRVWVEVVEIKDEDLGT